MASFFLCNLTNTISISFYIFTPVYHNTTFIVKTTDTMHLKLTRIPVILIMATLMIAIGCKKNTENSNPKVGLPVLTTDSIYVSPYSSAYCNATIQDTGAGKILRFGFCWGKSPNPVVDNQNSTTVDVTNYQNNHFQTSIGPIVSGNTYYIRAFASNKDGIGYGNEKTIVADSIPVVLLDGYYVKGTVTACSNLEARAMMSPAINETTQTLRNSLLELYIPIKAGAAGFSIVHVSGSARATFGPSSGFAIVTNAQPDEPKVVFQRGPVSSTSTAVFTVPVDGLYHVIFDYALNKVAIVPVAWGMIGAATPEGWGFDTMMTPSAFNLTTMAWELSDLTLQKAEWKFRYSQGWKVELDTSDPDPLKWIKVNTNLGGAVTALVPGGMNIYNAVAGKYTCNITYTLGSGYKATLTKTGNLPFTNWAPVVCDAVGTGISSDNPSAIPDPSGWAWGNKLLADAGGIPTKNGNVYSWLWTNIILEANQGFKIRTENGVAPPVGGASFDCGYSALNIAQSSSQIADDNGNLKATLKGSYTIRLNIDAANSDLKEIIIIKN
jgi:hypothetical protein